MKTKLDNKLVFSSVLLFVMIIVGVKQFNVTDKVKNNTKTNMSEINTTKEDNNIKIKLIINNKEYTATLIDNETSKDLVNMLPINIEMKELNGNEKYYNFDEKIKSNQVEVKKINKGDIMLFNDNCLVIFYNSLETTYKYTKIGSIDNPNELDLNEENVIVKIEK